MKAALESVLAMKAAGRPPKAIRAALEQMFPPDPTDRRDRFRCLKCQDTGLARVWSEVSIRAVMGGTIDEKKNQRQATVPCDCNTGHAKIAVSTDLKNRTGYRRRFDPKLDLVCRDPHHPDEIEQLVLWVENVTGVSRKKPEQKPVPERGLFDELIPGEVIDAEFEILPEEHDPDLLQQMEEFGDA